MREYIVCMPKQVFVAQLIRNGFVHFPPKVRLLVDLGSL